MKNRKIVLPAGAVLLCGILIAAIILMTQNRREPKEFSEDYVLAKELPALLSFTYYDVEGWEEQLKDTVKGKLSYRELSELLQKLGVLEYITYEAKAGFTSVPREIFFQVYGQLLDLLDTEQKVTSLELVFLGEEAKEGRWLTQQGYLGVEGGLSYLRQYDMYRVYTMNGAVLGLETRLDSPVTWENVFVHTTKEGTAQILFEQELFSVAVPELGETITDTICDIVFEENAVTAIYKKEETIQGTVLSYNEAQIEIEGYGALPHTGVLKIYKTYGTVEQLSESKLVIGNLVADFVVAKGQVCGIILKEPAKIEKIRVLLLNGETPYYSEVYVKGNEELTVTFQDSQQKIPAETMVKVSDYWAEGAEGFLRLTTATEQGNLFLTDANQQPVSLGYQGALEIRRFSEGYSLVNELSLEDYLCAVVPSEMPASYEMEALRAQAVCARSYACIQLTQGKYAGFAANVDDSTNYQVYNKQARNERSTLAVQDTVGEIISTNDTIAEAYYYSTSCGFSQDMDVWGLDPEVYGYLRSVSMLTDGSGPDISSEEAFAAFIQRRDLAAYDSDAPYFRWRAELNPAGSLEAMEAEALSRQGVNPENVQCFDAGGGEIPLDFAALGAVTGFVPEERSAGGALKKLKLQCEQGSILLATEYNIRRILGAAVTTMTDKDGKAISSMTMLPSAVFAVTPVEGGFVLDGGGYGHGIGMSQNGANGMAKAGFTYTDILQKFYQNITIENIYNAPMEQ